ncbi:ABC transporter substrate-binding protein [Reyranella sp.]|uniref:ABC transporter substrate-binding protein n=1 Tax=Reyranella sp. TaxID=1929291 RepID=UPI0011FED77A|nr:ABC transporter substrate-binding protein [Reyranella sp.]TAJ88101.1 MAG: peptide ABC transporter substrate-binding protein [Reyranella sp.]
MRICGVLGAVAALGLMATPALAQKSGGVMKMYFQDNPPSASIHEEATTSTVVPFMGLYNNLVLFDQQVPQNSLESIRPDLAESWSWSADGKDLTFKLVGNAKWHDGKPFTAADVKCTWDMLTGKSETQKLRKNPRASWYWNLDKVTTNGDREVTFHLGQPQPSFLVLLASGYSPVYSCHVPTAQMRTKPVGTGPFKLVEFKQKEGIKLTRNTDYFKKGKPYLDGIEISIVPARGTAILGFVSGRYDMSSPYGVTIPLIKDVKAQSANAVCKVAAMNNNTNLILNRDAPPFDNPDVRRAMLLSLDRKAFIDIITQGQSDVGGVMEPAPNGVWGLPKEMYDQIAGYGPDVEKNRAEGREIMKKLGYGPDNKLKLKVSTRNHLLYRDPAVILIDQLKEVYFEGELDLVDTAIWYAKVARKDYAIGLNTTGNGVDDPDQNYFENYACKSERNYTGYCSPEIEKLFTAQSAERDVEKRKKIVWDIDRKLLEDGARPVIMWNAAGTCWHPYVKGYAPMVNSLYNGSRFEEIWLDK